MAGGRATRDDETEPRVSHVIRAVEPKGSPALKRRTRDTLIVYLERLIRSLAATLGRTGYEGPSRYIDAPAWPWLAGGIVMVVLFVVLLVAAWIRYA